ncbi:stage III sporulation protein AF [Aneurinibacillus migulanus]|jgi:stage III sporulation protein AF|nr:stage III sporulation protein AF [Aneurinibacillus migulanus]MED0891639.1 stage III sporulation protein AF [Aneurinibacillus migulanus]MED1617621.1 stage III sporulation protein AF [Aneurinibacillus migulanus]GED12979.1 hypothetical protein AMI01nite_09700 [Aneurinibacillus migulanus]
MMAMLILWLKKIILLVLLATFLDLLLPSNTYSKYVKLVMGLLILLALVSPLLDLFRKDIPFAQLSFAIEKGAGQTQNPDFTSVDALAKKLAAQNDQETNRYVEEQISGLVKKQVETQHGVRVQQVHVQVNSEGQKTGQPIERISVVLAPGKAQEKGGKQSEQGVSVEPVKPVKVEISLDSRNEGVHPPAEKEQSVAVVAEQKRTEEAIEAGISAAWNVPGDAVRITWSDAGEEG